MAKQNAGKNPFVALTLIFSVSIAAYLLSLTNLFQGLEYRIYDSIFHRRGPVDVSKTNTVIVAVDQHTFDSLAFPFDRVLYAELIDKLVMLDAKQIVFDILFTGPSNRPESDSIMRESIANARNVVLCGEISLVYKKGISKPLSTIVPPHSSASPEDTKWGLINDLFDADGVVRRYPLFLQSDEIALPTLGLKVFALDRGFSVDSIDFVSHGDFQIGGMSIPRVHDLSSTLLNYYGPAGTFPTYSFVDVIAGNYDLAAMWAAMSDEEKQVLTETGMDSLFRNNPFEGKIVLVGASAEDLQDNKITPFFSANSPRRTPGVEVHANALQMFADQSFIRPVPLYFLLVCVLLLGVAIYFIGKHATHWSGILLTIALLVIIGISGYYLLTSANLWLRQVPLLATIALGYPTNLLYRFIHSQREKAMIRGMFTQYLPKSYVQQLIQHPEMLKLGGERRRMSMLFTDVAGFSTVSERLTPEELVQLLNEYLTAMSRVVFANDGIVDKYEGDLIMAEWGAPIWTPDHASQACRSALQMQKKLAEMRLKWREEGRIELHSRVGVNSGDVIVGNMGSEDKFDYTVMGDAVNLASRLEGANKAYGTTIMIGYNTWVDVKDHFITRPLDLLKVVGKNEPVEVFELLGEDKSDVSEEKLRAIAIYQEGMTLYRAREFQSALAKFKEALEADPTDKPSKVYVERCGLMIENPPDEHWIGVWELKEK